MKSSLSIPEDVAKIDSSATSTHQVYPSKELRYYRTWWNRNSQRCYTDAELFLLKKITTLYLEIIGDEKNVIYFKTDRKSFWYDTWHCDTPSETIGSEPIDHLHASDTYTLPNRPNKDSKLYPLWGYADSLAKTIANWQSDRVRNQALEVMNDPIMLILDELRHWFYHELSLKECTVETLNEISKRQSYLKSITHTIPDFGLDRYRLHSLSIYLHEAAELIKHCIANKELPQLLSDLTTSGKNLETTLSSYLHFLLINEKVADNFSPEMMNTQYEKCDHSPICKIYQANDQMDLTIISKKLLDYSKLPKFLKFTNEKVNQDSLDVTAHFQLSPLNQISFASFVKDEQKQDYLRAAASLEALASIRKTFEKFNSLQTKIGSYLFASHYLELSNQLAEHYIHLIDSTNHLINKLIKHAESGHSMLLQNQQLRKLNAHFEHNLRALDTQFAKGTTTTLQLNQFCTKAVENIENYQHEMKKLVSTLQTGEAAEEVSAAMNELYQQMNHLNQVIPALLGQSKLHIDLNQPPSHHFNATQTDESALTINRFHELNQLQDETNLSTPPPPSFTENLITSIGQSVLHGVLKGSANALGNAIPSTNFYKNIFTQAIYLSGVFVTSFTYHAYEELSHLNDPLTALNTATMTALGETTRTAFVNNGIHLASSSLEAMGDFCANHEWNLLGSGLKKASLITRYGFFAYSTITKGDFSTLEESVKTVATTAVSMGAGIAAQQVTEANVQRLIRGS